MQLLCRMQRFPAQEECLFERGVPVFGSEVGFHLRFTSSQLDKMSINMSLSDSDIFHARLPFLRGVFIDGIQATSRSINPQCTSPTQDVKACQPALP